MKNKFTARLCIFMCLVLIVSMFAACNIKDKNGDASLTTLAPDDSWRPGNDGTYEPVILSKVELAELVSEALGEDAKDFNGDLNSLTPEQIQKVEDLAEDKGLIIDKDDSGNTAWLRGLSLYLENERGERFESCVNGISASGDPDGEGYGTFWLDSPFFSRGEHLSLCIT